MFKPLTLSLSLAVALGAASMSMAGGLHSGCSTCGIASPQGVAPSAQGPLVSAQCETPCAPTCAPKTCAFKKIDWAGMWAKCHKPKVYTYEWVLKKKRVWCPKTTTTCETVYPSGQGIVASPQASGQYAAPQTLGSGQAFYGAPVPTVAVETASIPAGDEAPPAPAAPIDPEPSVPAANAPQSSLLFSTPAGN